MRNGGIDFHCDAVSKLLTGEASSFSGSGAVSLDVSYEQLAAADAVMQTFAIYIPERLEPSVHMLVRSMDLFFEHIASHPGMMLIQSAEDLRQAIHTGKIGALLSLEGADALGGDPALLRLLYRLGLRSLGLTWNYANWAADGVMEPRGGGLTHKGKALVKLCNELGILLDVSHLAEKGFWEVLDLSERPVIASHSNARAICDHPRNLSDSQIYAIISRGGAIGITYVPWFVSGKAYVDVNDLKPHIDHILQLGGDRSLMLGSDFDGIDRYINGLRNPVEAATLHVKLMEWYGEALAERIKRDNAVDYLLAQLPRV